MSVFGSPVFIPREAAAFHATTVNKQNQTPLTPDATVNKELYVSQQSCCCYGAFMSLLLLRLSLLPGRA